MLLCPLISARGVPPNDDCHDALAITEGMYPFTTLDATNQGPHEAGDCRFFSESNVSGDVWFCYRASSSGTATVSLCDADYDTTLAVYTGCTCPPETSPITCNDDGCSVQSRVSLSVCAGQHYLIRIAGFGGAAGPGTLSIMLGPPKVFFVNGNAPSGGDGLCWSAAFNDLQVALDAARDSSGQATEIWVAQGTYTPDRGTGDRSLSFELINGVAIYGGFTGTETNRDQRDVTGHRTTLSGDLQANDGVFTNLEDNSYRVVLGSRTDETARLDGFTISGGHASKAEIDVPDSGGGMHIESGSPAVANCTFMRNRALIFGGGLYVFNGSPALDHCRFIENRALVGGGMASQISSDPTLTACAFTRNVAVAGGGMNIAFSKPRLVNCTFIDNVATDGDGGGIRNSQEGKPHLMNCTLVRNSAELEGGGIANVSDSATTLTNCVLWYNASVAGSQISLTLRSTMTVDHSNVQGGATGIHVDTLSTLSWQDGNIDVLPLLTLDGHLRSGSPCIDAGTLTDAAEVDTDGEARPDGINTDMGSDEFIDRDNDGLADWWETRHFGDLASADPTADPDGDGMINQDEYERFGSDPVAVPFYVDAQVGSEAFDGSTPIPLGMDVGPKRTIQAALDVVESGGTILVQPGLYGGAGNQDLYAQGKQAVVRAPAGPDETFIFGSPSNRLIRVEPTRPNPIWFEGFTIIRGQVDPGGAFRIEHGLSVLTNCVIADGRANTKANALFADRATLQIDGLILRPNGMTDPAVRDAFLSNSTVTLSGAMVLDAGSLEARSSWFDGPPTGRLELSPGATFHIRGATPNAAPSVLRTDVIGPGHIDIAAGQQLTVEDDAVIDLDGTPGPDGSINVEGILIVRDRAVIRNARIDVRLARLEDSATIQFNDISLLDSTGFGGQFFVEGGTHIVGNTIVSEGDRYLDLDPNPRSPVRPQIADNSFSVEIREGMTTQRGTLLELRARDLHCLTEPCGSGMFQLASTEFAFPNEDANNWVLERLEIFPNAKLNLTNRQGFEFHADGPDTIYVKELILHSNAVLNLGGQRLYYETLSANEDSEIMDVPLLGFSLGVIAMNDTTEAPNNEFDIRVRRRLSDPNDYDPDDPDLPLPEGSIRLVGDHRAVGDGAMVLETRNASSVAAKGRFGRAGEDEIIVTFEYRFADRNGEVLVSLSDESDVSRGNIPLAIVESPPPGAPGSPESEAWATFYGAFPRSGLNLTRAMFVELELRGKESRCWIDNWDPFVTCDVGCGDFDPDDGVTAADFLLLVAEYGQALRPNSMGGHPKGCLDLTADAYVDLNDLLAWDALHLGARNLCPPLSRQPDGTLDADTGDESHNPVDALFVAGKDAGTNDRLYRIGWDGECLGPFEIPATEVRQEHGWGRLTRDNHGRLFQIHALRGLIALEDDRVIVEPRSNLPFGTDTVVHVGLDPDTIEPRLPIMDAVVHVADSTIVYVVPVLVESQGGPDQAGSRFRAAAKLELDDNSAEYRVAMLYVPETVADNTTTVLSGEVVQVRDLRGLRELELDPFGNLYVISAHAINDNNWLLIYDEGTGEQRATIPLGSAQASDPSITTEAPTALAVANDHLYVASALSEGTTSRIARYTIVRSEEDAVDGITLDGFVLLEHSLDDVADRGFGHKAAVTTIAVGTDGSAWALGFVGPRFAENDDLPNDVSDLLTRPSLARIPVETEWRVDDVMTLVAGQAACNGLALPVSAVLPGRGDLDADGDVDLLDFLAFQECLAPIHFGGTKLSDSWRSLRNRYLRSVTPHARWMMRLTVLLKLSRSPVVIRYLP